MEHFKEVDFRGKKYKVGDKVWTLDGGRKRQQYIVDIFDDTPFEDDDYITKCCYTSNERYNSLKCFNRLEEVYYNEWEVERAEYRWKSDYDDYVTSR